MMIIPRSHKSGLWLWCIIRCWSSLNVSAT